MGIGNELQTKLAAAALMRQLNRSAARGEQAAPKSELADTRAGNRFESMAQYQQVRMMRELGEKLRVASPFFRVHEGIAGATTQIDGREYLNYANYNYLDLAGDPRVLARSKEAIDRYGISASASRMVAGERPVHRELECALASFYETPDALVFVSGHATNVTVIGSLFGPGDLIICDALAHNSVVQGAQLSGAKRLTFPHNDWRALDALLARVRHEYRNVLVAIEGLYSMDGDLPDLPKFVDIRRRHDVFLMVDEAHSLGVLGESGRGIREHCGVASDQVDIWMGTLSKALAGCGGYVAGSQTLIDMLRHLAPGFLYSVAIPPAVAAASLQALEILRQEPERGMQLRARGTQFLQEARAAGLNTGSSAGYAVVPVILGSSASAARWANALFEDGINVQPIFYPAVEEKAARLRFFVCASHTEQQITHTVQAMVHLGGRRQDVA